MPRKRPGALRAHPDPARRWDTAPPDRIRGLSTSTSRAIQRYEQLDGSYYVFPGATDRALRRYRRFLSPVGTRPRYPRAPHCSCRGCSFDDVRHARDVLAEVLSALPPRPGAELARVLRPMDAAYLRRTLPDPFAERIRPAPWWYGRLGERWECGS
ncbi:magnesium and cobalt transport protein CorA [Kitasatospora cathayae]|uniref:Uncharacterized protein n=1 Tax=Kitasatospora cathayae TaxID=3004092 RepID=A0ABY7Q3A7_9ACTN|nr:hypothetical protein [Kitasatospora sp. HUAS 3-15]WBP87181.1 hypothetical protein O1G21_15910 [Kitasatospora sp. HUAS 3-15]